MISTSAFKLSKKTSRKALAGILISAAVLLLSASPPSSSSRVLTSEDDLQTLAVGAFSFIYNMIFEEEDVSQDIQDIQTEVRIHQDCTMPDELDFKHFFTNTDHPDSVTTTISCKAVHYRLPRDIAPAIRDSIVFGVLSGGPAGKARRNSIRNTWGHGSPVIFIVAGNWSHIKKEYNDHRDILWVDQREIYRNEQFNPTSGALTFKTEAFLTTMYNQVVKQNPNVEYFFKTDDDVYVDVKGLKQRLIEQSERKPVDYWGACYKKLKPHRGETTRWFVSQKNYPFTYYPKFCIGSGYIVSPKLLECAVGQGHIERVKYLTNEDGAVGLLAERCGIEPSTFHQPFPHQISTELRIREDLNKDDLMKNTIVQHNVKTEEDMLAMHESVIKLAQEIQ